SRRRHTRFSRDWSSDVCSSDLAASLGSETGLEQVVVRLVPAFADGCSVVLPEDDGYRIATACAAGLDQAGTEWLHAVDRLHGAEGAGGRSVGARRSLTAILGGTGQVDRGEIRVVRGPARPPFDEG